MTANEYLKIILKKKNLKQSQVLREMNKRKMSDKGVPISKQYISNVMNGIRTLSPCMARKFEIVLGLEKYSLVNIVGFPKGKELENLKKVDEFEH